MPHRGCGTWGMNAPVYLYKCCTYLRGTSISNSQWRKCQARPIACACGVCIDRAPAFRTCNKSRRRWNPPRAASSWRPAALNAVYAETRPTPTPPVCVWGAFGARLIRRGGLNVERRWRTVDTVDGMTARHGLRVPGRAGSF